MNPTPTNQAVIPTNPVSSTNPINSGSEPGGSTLPPSSAPSSPSAPELSKGQAEGVSQKYTPSQIVEIHKTAHELVASGRMSKEQMDLELQKDGIPFPSIESLNQTPVAREIDAAFPPAKPEHYDIPNQNQNLDIKTVLKNDSQFRDWLSKAGFTKQIGSYIASEIESNRVRYETMTSGEKTLWERSEAIKLENIFKNETENKVGLGMKLISELEQKSPGITKFLKSNGANANVMINIIKQAERLLAKSEERMNKK